MASFNEYRRRGIIPLAVVALAIYYLFALMPLSRKEQELDARLRIGWQKLSTALHQTNATAIDFLHITNQLNETRLEIALIENAKKSAAARLELGAAVRAKMSAPFQFVIYQDERSKQMDQISKLAKQCQVTVEPAVFAGFPEYTADIKQPALLWAALSLVESLLSTAVQCKVGLIQSLEVPLALTNEPLASATPSLAEIPLQAEFTGSAASLLKFIQNLPLRADEMRAAGVPEGPAEKAPLFIDRLIIKKQSPDKPDEVHVFLRVVGFVLRE